MVSVQILIFHIASQGGKAFTMIGDSPLLSSQRSIIGRILFRKETVIYISELLSDRTACPAHPFVRLRNLIIKHNLVLGISPIGSDMISDIPDLVFPTSRHLETFIINFTHIYDRQTYGKITGVDVTGYQNVFAVFDEVIKRRFQTAVKKVQINTIILFGGCFPSYIRVTDPRFFCTDQYIINY